MEAQGIKKELNLSDVVGYPITVEKVIQVMNQHQIPQSAEFVCDIYDGGSILLFWDE